MEEASHLDFWVCFCLKAQDVQIQMQSRILPPHPHVSLQVPSTPSPHTAHQAAAV